MNKKILCVFLTVLMAFMSISAFAEDKKELNFKDEKIGVALASGGLLGSYELGALQYLSEQGVELTDFDSAVGTSVGAIILGSTLTNGLSATEDLFLNIKATDIYKGQLSNSKCDLCNRVLDRLYTRGNNIGNLLLIARGLGGQLNTEPLRQLIKDNISEQAIKNSGVETSVFTSSVYCPIFSLSKPCTPEWIIASSSCYPVFSPYSIHNRKYIDGGYINTTNAEALFRKYHCDKAVIIDLRDNSKTWGNDERVVYIKPSVDLGSFLDTNPEHIRRNFEQGYADARACFENKVDIVK